MPKLEGVIKGIRSTQAKSDTPKKNRLPITPAILHRIRTQWEVQGSTRDHVMLWAAATLDFFDFLRAGEITVPSDSAFDPKSHLTFEDVSVDNILDPQLLKVRLKTSKTHPFRKGGDVYVGKTGNDLCPYLAVRSSKPGFLFLFGNGQLLTNLDLWTSFGRFQQPPALKLRTVHDIPLELEQPPRRGPAVSMTLPSKCLVDAPARHTSSTSGRTGINWQTTLSSWAISLPNH